MPRLSRISAAVAAVAAIAVGLAALNPAENQGPAAAKQEMADFAALTSVEIGEQARTAMEKVRSFRIEGIVLTGHGKQWRVNLSVDRERNCAGNLVEDEGVAQLIVNAESAHVRANREFWVAHSGPAQERAGLARLADRWVKLPREDIDLDIACDPAVLDDAFISAVPTRRGDKGDLTWVAGRRVIELAGQDRTGESKVWVSLAKPHHVVQTRLYGAYEGYTLTNFDVPVDVTAPVTSDLLDLMPTALA